MVARIVKLPFTGIPLVKLYNATRQKMRGREKKKSKYITPLRLIQRLEFPIPIRLSRFI